MFRKWQSIQTPRGPTLGSLKGTGGRASCRTGMAGRGNSPSFVRALSRDLEMLMLFREDTFEIPRKFITKKA